MDSRDGSERKSRPGWTDEQVDVIIANLLRTGLILAAGVVMIGAAIFLSRHGHERVFYDVFRGEPRSYREVGNILVEAGRFHGRGFIMAGLLLLIATPIARVAFSVVAFLRQKDYVYVAATIFVLSVLAFSVFWLGLH
jgi:uncharacterized membrane protein